MSFASDAAQSQNPMELICELTKMTDMLIHEYAQLKGGGQNLKYTSSKSLFKQH